MSDGQGDQAAADAGGAGDAAEPRVEDADGGAAPGKDEKAEKPDGEAAGTAAGTAAGEGADGAAGPSAPSVDAGYEYQDDTSYRVPAKVTLQESLAADSGDEALQRWKAALVTQGATEIRGERDVVFESILVTSPDLPAPIRVSVEEASRLAQQKQPCFVLKQGATFSVGFTWRVYNDVVMGLNCVTKIFRLGICLRKGQVMFGCFAPRPEPYQFFLPEEQAPSSSLGKGLFVCRARLSDDDRRNLGGFDYVFKVDKDWAV